MRNRWRVALLLVSTPALFGGLRDDVSPQRPQSLDSTTVAENRELDRRLLEAHERKDQDMLLSLFSKSPDTFFITPSGMVIKGLGRMRESFVRFFASLRSIHGQIKDVTYLPAADGVIAVGTVNFHRELQDGTLDDRTVVWTDFRRKEQGKWVYMFRHAHWPAPAGK